MYFYVSDTNVWIDIFGLAGGMNGATSTVTAGSATSSLPSKNKVHSEIRNLEALGQQGALKGKDVIISDVTGHFPNGVNKEVQVCAECRHNMFQPLIDGEANSITIPRKGGDPITIMSEDFKKAQIDTGKILDKYTGTRKYKKRSDESFEASERHNKYH